MNEFDDYEDDEEAPEPNYRPITTLQAVMVISFILLVAVVGMCAVFFLLFKETGTFLS